MSLMDDQDEFSDSKTSENSVSATPDTPGGDALLMLPPCHDKSSSKRRNRSMVWEHFIVEPGPEKKAKCNYCSCLIKYANGTSSMMSHLKRCKNNPNKEGNKRQATILSSSQSGLTSPPIHFNFDQEECHNELVKMFVAAGLPYPFVENEDFRRFLSVLQPRFIVPSRTTLLHDMLALYDVERKNLRKDISQHCCRVCLTIDSWISDQNLNYMSLTVHFIDNDWKLHRKILNFRQISSHAGEVISKNVEICLENWELNRVLSLTVDDASSNDLRIHYLKKKLHSWNSLILKGEYIHMHCCAHILNLIAKEALDEIDDSILRIHAAVKYIRSSPSRMLRFNGCAEESKIQYNGLVCLDFETRWDSTYLMLEAALKHKNVFELLELQDSKYIDELRREKGESVPLESDWDCARSILPSLKIFYDSILRISSTSYITSNIYMKEVFHIGRKILQYCESSDLNIRLMANRVKNKFDKYLGNPSSINMLLLIAVVLDPRHKLGYVNHFLEYFFGAKQGSDLKSKLLSCLKSLYEQYQGIEEVSESDQPETQINDDEDDLHGMGFFLRSIGQNSNAKSELDKYLKEDCEPFNKSVELDVLTWWKANSSRFPILANMAREVLAIPVSTVASESAFSLGERVLDPFRSSLPPKMVEAFVCTQNWVKGKPFSMFSMEDIKQDMKFEQEIFSQHDVGCSDSFDD